jgi:hypothetical protein
MTREIDPAQRVSHAAPSFHSQISRLATDINGVVSAIPNWISAASGLDG